MHYINLHGLEAKMLSSRVSSGERIMVLGKTSLLNYLVIESNGNVVETVLEKAIEELSICKILKPVAWCSVYFPLQFKLLLSRLEIVRLSQILNRKVNWKYHPNQSVYHFTFSVKLRICSTVIIYIPSCFLYIFIRTVDVLWQFYNLYPYRFLTNQTLLI